MNKKIIGILVFTLIIVTTFTATGVMNIQTTWLVNKNNYFQPNQNNPANSPNLITIRIVAKIVGVNDPNNVLGGTVKVNGTIKGKYTNDLNATDEEPDPKIGIYRYYSSPCGIEVKAGEGCL